MARWPVPAASGFTKDLEADWDRLFRASRDIAREIEKLRAAKALGKSTEAVVDLVTEDEAWHAALSKRAGDLAGIFMVSEVRLHKGQLPGAVKGTDAPPVSLAVAKSPHPKCERCWNLRADVGQSPKHPACCARCVAVLAEIGA